MPEASLYPTSLDTTNIYEVVARLSTTLSADITAATTTIPLTATTGFPTAGYIVIDNETIKYTSVAVGSVDATGGRGHAGTAASHTDTTQVLVAVTAAVFNKLRAGMIAIQTYAGTSGGTQGGINAKYLGGSTQGQLQNAVYLGGSTNTEFVNIAVAQTITGVKTLTSPLFTGTIDGWISTGTFTYASTTTITVASGAALIYQKGDKLRFKQDAGTYKYYYVVSVADTVLTVTGGSDYAVLNEAITVPAYSHVENPLGFPSMFNFAETYTGFSADPSSDCKFYISGGNCIYIVAYTGSGTSNAVGKTITAPITNAQGATVIGLGIALDNTAWQTTPCMAQLGNNSATVTVYKAIFGVAWTASGTCGFGFVLIYKI